MINYRSLKQYKYQLMQDYSCQLPWTFPSEFGTKWVKVEKNGLITICSGYCWDGPSGPTIDTKNFMRGSLVHDALYQLMREGFLSSDLYRIGADQLLRQHCKEDGMCSFRAWYVYHSVRIFAGRFAKPKGK